MFYNIKINCNNENKYFNNNNKANTTFSNIFDINVRFEMGL